MSYILILTLVKKLYRNLENRSCDKIALKEGNISQELLWMFTHDNVSFSVFVNTSLILISPLRVMNVIWTFVATRIL